MGRGGSRGPHQERVRGESFNYTSTRKGEGGRENEKRKGGERESPTIREGKKERGEHIRGESGRVLR